MSRSHSRTSSPVAGSVLPFLLRARRHWRGGAACAFAVAALVLMWHSADPSPGQGADAAFPTQALLPGFGFGLGAGVLWAFGRAMLGTRRRFYMDDSLADEPADSASGESSPPPPRPRSSFPPAPRVLTFVPPGQSARPARAASTSGAAAAEATANGAIVEPARGSSDESPDEKTYVDTTAEVEYVRQAPRESQRTSPPHDATPPRQAAASASPSSPPRSVENVFRTPIPAWSLTAEIAESAPLEELQELSHQICILALNECFVVGVSSGLEGEALKSRLAVQLAWTLAASQGVRVLLVEADFDEPAVGREMQMEVPPLMGFSQQIHRRTSSRFTEPWKVIRCADNLGVLAEGRVRTPGMLYSEQFSSALASLREQYDVIIAHGPIIGNTVNTRALDAVTDGIVLAVPLGSPIEEAQESSAAWLSDKELFAVVPTRHSRRS